ncbi:hypothetical protein CRG98_016849 [Punica granatum]|uniref:Uncharacterized protein n=1 Tax=Punica granatum TaxID=22663 RepID=A0A2I0K3N9_PUNGR|nr:hypothetical protein CRG98_016849 [Punica granatum]
MSAQAGSGYPVGDSPNYKGGGGVHKAYTWYHAQSVAPRSRHCPRPQPSSAAPTSVPLGPSSSSLAGEKSDYTSKDPSRARRRRREIGSSQLRDLGGSQPIANASSSIVTRVSSDQDYFASQLMNHTVRLLREKLDKIQSSGEHLRAAGPAVEEAHQDNRRKI